MAKTYGGDPENSRLDAVRLLIGDTDCATAYLEDGEVLYFSGLEGNVNFAAARAAEAIAAKLARRYDTSGAISKAQGALAEKYLKLAASLRARGNESATVYAGGLSIAEKQTDAENDDLVQPSFERGMHDNPKARSAHDLRRTRWDW